MKLVIPKHIERSVLCRIACITSLIFAVILMIIVVTLATIRSDYTNILITTSGSLLMLGLSGVSKLIMNHYEALEFREFIETMQKEKEK